MMLNDSPDAQCRAIIRWLAAPDPSINHNAARTQHSATTGSWFIDSDHFQNWWHKPEAFLWVYGRPGCGKTVLASTIIEHVEALCEDTKIRSAYFYFDFTQEAKQTVSGFLRSMLAQLCSTGPVFPQEIRELYSKHMGKKQQPSIESLVTTFLEVLRCLKPVCITLDALDECSTIHSPERETMLKLIYKVKDECAEGVKMLILSRQERDIEDELHSVFTDRICIQNRVVDNDIGVHVRKLLADDSRLRKWPPAIKEEIHQSLVQGAHGM